MPDLTNAQIQKGEQQAHRQWYHIDADEGYVNATLTHDSDTYTIRFYRVRDAFIGQGYGRELLRIAKEHAALLGARAITSTNLSSDESIKAMAAVFGHQQITSAIDPDTSRKITTLDYTIQDTDPPLRSDVQILPGLRQSSMSPIRRYFEQQEVSVRRSANTV